MIHREITPPLYRQARERFLYLYVTTSCGLRCKHCYVGNERLNHESEISLEFAKAVMAYFRVAYGHDKLYILGGEPTRHPRLKEIVDLAKEQDYSVSITSNGEFDSALFDSLTPRELSSWNFSLESAYEEIHARIRGSKTNFATVSARIREASSHGHQVRVTTTLSKANIAQALDLIDYVASLGAHTLSFHNLGMTGNAPSRLEALSIQEWREFCHQLSSLPAHPRLAVYYPPSYVPIEEQSHWSSRGYPGCPARTFDRPHVYPDGKVYACPVMMDEEAPYAYFDGTTLRPNTAESSEYSKIMQLDEICLDCSAYRSCGGGCPAYGSLAKYADKEVRCDRQMTPLCILWTTYAWGTKPATKLHEWR